MQDAAPFSAFEHACMQRALALAENGLYTTRPNPRVGCVLTQQERVIGEGFHAQAGFAHAEVHALQDALRQGEPTRGCTVYVTLEPCAHTGRTPPCVDALVQANVARVVIACCDPFAQVDGRGIEQLRAAGIEVKLGLLQSQARALNAGFFSRVQRKRPWLRLKLASSLDGRIALANGQSQWLTSGLARQDGHRFRARACGIMSGIGTISADDPALDARLDADSLAALPALLSPQLKVIVDPDLRTPTHARVLQSVGATLLVHGQIDRPVPRPARGLLHDFSHPNALANLLSHLTAVENIQELHIEAGSRLSGSLLAADLVDELLLYQAPMLLGASALPMAALPALHDLSGVARWQLIDTCVFGPDVRLRYLSAAAAAFLSQHEIK